MFGAYSYDPPPIVAYAARDLDLDPDQFRVEVEHAPSVVGSPSSDATGQWYPDFEFRVREKTSRHEYGYDGPVCRRYVAEVKHGATSFGRNQRAQMEGLAAESGPDTAVLVVRVDLGAAPQNYDVRITPVADLQ
ncbi:MAG: hypothetical protein ABEI77_09800 [Halorientalis sp.]